ncbi:MAG: OmpH family outer membrane protein [Bacteroidetes bacterium]|nr:MAG: OmpH family outer membrane protein [Bacteroidota bacterium]
MTTSIRTTLLKLTSLTLLLALPLSASFAQRIAYVDVKAILESIKEYQEAQEELDKIAATWRQEIAQEYDKIKGMYNRYQAEQVLLSDEERRQREDQIMEEERRVRELQKQRFGPEGDLFKKRQELVQPIQDRVYSAIEEYAQERGYDFIFDVSGPAGIIFSNPEYDKTSDILKKLARN